MYSFHSHSGAPFQNLYEVLFYSINLFCSRTDLEAPIKVIAFDSMVMWLSSCKNMMRLSMNDKGQLDQHMVTSASAILDENNTDQLIHYVWDHWDDPIDAIQHKASGSSCLMKASNLIDTLSIIGQDNL